MKKLELLMPAWNLEKMKYAFAYWADAVYAWVPMFSLRARENQFSWEDLGEAVKYAHDRSKKIYFTANIYAHNVKIKPFMEAFKRMEELKPDAYIMSDPGLIWMVRKEYPNAEIHLSVQANNTNWAQVKFWQEIWIKRVILSREISLREIKEIHENCPEMELEFFVHWAICMAYSGRCLLSNYMAHRDPNQWTCAHSCRWEYKIYKNEIEGNDLYENTWRPEDYKDLSWEYFLEERERKWELLPVDEDEFWTYIMNSRDMCLLDYIEELKDAWIISFKVEWRSKTINYLAWVGRAYRKAVDAAQKWEKYNTPELIKELFAISNRWYIPGFITWDLWDKSIYYEKNSELKEEDFVWIVRWYDNQKKIALVEVKNRIDLGDVLRLISPGFDFEFKLEKIIDLKWEEKEAAHWWGFNVWINMDENPGEYALLRRKIDL